MKHNNTTHHTDNTPEGKMRKSNETKANELAARRGITITTDHNDRGGIIHISLDGPYMKLRGYHSNEVEVWVLCCGRMG